MEIKNINKTKALEITQLFKQYETGVEALSGIDLSVEEGDFFALLGPNGAGKSTTIGIISSLVHKTRGKVALFGLDMDTDLDKAKRYIGLVPQEFNFNVFEKVMDILINQAGYYGIPRKLAIERATFYLKKLGIWEKAEAPARTLSGGMKRRLMIARALVHEPKLLILDEPTAGLDIELRRAIWAFLSDINQQGKTIILTTHYLEEAEQLCNNVAIINHGKIIENTSVKLLLSRLDVQILVLDLKAPYSDITKLKKIQAIQELNGFEIYPLDSQTLEVHCKKDWPLGKLFSVLSEQGIEVISLRNKTNRLEELFLQLVHKKSAGEAV